MVVVQLIIWVHFKRYKLVNPDTNDDILKFEAKCSVLSCIVALVIAVFVAHDNEYTLLETARIVAPFQFLVVSIPSIREAIGIFKAYKEISRLTGGGGS